MSVIFGLFMILRFLSRLLLLKHPKSLDGWCEVVLVVVECLNFEAGCVIGFEGRQTAFSINLVSACLPQLKGYLDVLLLAYLVKGERSIVSALFLLEWAHGLRQSGIRVGA